MRLKTDYRTTSAATYKKFSELNPDIEISYEDWKKVLYTYTHIIRDYILDSGDIAKMPFGIGLFAISKRKVSKIKVDPYGKEWINMPIDWKKTKEAGKYIYHFNNHSDGYRYKWKWFIKTARFHLAFIWNFTPHRDSSRKLATYIKKPGSKYSEIYKEWGR